MPHPPAGSDAALYKDAQRRCDAVEAFVAERLGDLEVDMVDDAWLVAYEIFRPAVDECAAASDLRLHLRAVRLARDCLRAALMPSATQVAPTAAMWEDARAARCTADVLARVPAARLAGALEELKDSRSAAVLHIYAVDLTAALLRVDDRVGLSQLSEWGVLTLGLLCEFPRLARGPIAAELSQLGEYAPRAVAAAARDQAAAVAVICSAARSKLLAAAARGSGRLRGPLIVVFEEDATL